MSENVMTVQIITPDGVVYDHHAKFISVHTTGGDMGILPNMISTIAGLRIDEIKVERPDSGDHIDYIAVNGGIIEVKNSLVTIISDSSERDRNIDVNRAERAKERAEHDIEQAKTEHKADDIARAEVELRRAMNRLNVAKHL